jgi:hypothetical protein
LAKFLLSFLLTGLVLLQPLVRIGTLAVFSAKQKEIALKLCEKKDIPGNTCQGRCQLKKELKKISETERKSNATDKPDPEKQFFTRTTNLPRPVTAMDISVQHNWAAPSEVLQGHHLPLTPPPDTLVG